MKETDIFMINCDTLQETMPNGARILLRSSVRLKEQKAKCLIIVRPTIPFEVRKVKESDILEKNISN